MYRWSYDPRPDAEPDPATPRPPGGPPTGPSGELKYVDLTDQPYTSAELLRCLWLPHRGLEMALGHRDRLAASLGDSRVLALLAAVLLFVSVIAALPYGLIAPSSGSGPAGVPDLLRVTLLYLGSVALCLPSLLVFAVFLGLPLRGGQLSVLALLVCAVAAAFSFGFFPITWFIDVTTVTDESSRFDVHTLSSVLLVFGFLMGVAHLLRSVLQVQIERGGALMTVLGLAWMLLLMGIVHRMAVLLGLW